MATLIITNTFKQGIKPALKLLSESKNKSEDTYLHLYSKDNQLWCHAIVDSIEIYNPICPYDEELNAVVDYKKLNQIVNCLSVTMVCRPSNSDDSQGVLIGDANAKVKLFNFTELLTEFEQLRDNYTTEVTENGFTVHKDTLLPILNYLNGVIPKTFTEYLMDSVYFTGEKAFIYDTRYIASINCTVEQELALSKPISKTVLSLLQASNGTLMSIYKNSDANTLEMVIGGSYLKVSRISHEIKDISPITNIFEAEAVVSVNLNELIRFIKISDIFLNKEGLLNISIVEGKMLIKSDNDLDKSQCSIDVQADTPELDFDINSYDLLNLIKGLVAFQVESIELHIDLDNDCIKISHFLGESYITIND